MFAHIAQFALVYSIRAAHVVALHPSLAALIVPALFFQLAVRAAIERMASNVNEVRRARR